MRRLFRSSSLQTTSQGVLQNYNRIKNIYRIKSETASLVRKIFTFYTGKAPAGYKSKSTMVQLNDELPSMPPSSSSVVVSGILFSRSVRSSFASFTVAPIWSSSTAATATTNLPMSENGQFRPKSPFLVRLQLMDNVQELRSFCRKQYKIGDQIDFLYTEKGRWERPSSSATETKDRSLETKNKTEEVAEQSWSQKPRWVIDLSSTAEAQTSILLRQSRVWSMKDCQQYQLRYIPKRKRQQHQELKLQKNKNNRNDGSEPKSKEHSASSSSSLNTIDEHPRKGNGHGGGKEKRLQAQELVSFFIRVIRNKIESDPQRLRGEDVNATTPLNRNEIELSVREWFNRGDGVLDVAGGCGHVSMALGMNGIMSTVVDARSSVGKLPGRDRKIWKRSLMNEHTTIRKKQQVSTTVAPGQTPLFEFDYCHTVVSPPPIVLFKSQQAWFGSKPDGYDATFRHPDEEDIPVMVATAISNNDINQHANHYHAETINTSNDTDDCADTSKQVEDFSPQSLPPSPTLHRQASALVALHPDEATGEIVQQAVKHRIPFVVVPCCVFARLFPNRETKDGRSVSSYEDLLDFLQDQDPSIQRTKLSFGGKNYALWSIFPDG